MIRAWTRSRGDVVMYGPQWQRSRVDVTEAHGGMVRGIMDNHDPVRYSIRQWREWMRDAEVLNVA